MRTIIMQCLADISATWQQTTHQELPVGDLVSEDGGEAVHRPAQVELVAEGAASLAQHHRLVRLACAPETEIKGQSHENLKKSTIG